jgi:hypothetical protein
MKPPGADVQQQLGATLAVTVFAASRLTRLRRARNWSRRMANVVCQTAFKEAEQHWPMLVSAFSLKKPKRTPRSRASAPS